jgi:hypothetical protein
VQPPWGANAFIVSTNKPVLSKQTQAYRRPLNFPIATSANSQCPMFAMHGKVHPAFATVAIPAGGIESGNPTGGRNEKPF